MEEGKQHHVFLDANVYLLFFKLSDADVIELGRLVTLVKSGEVKLYLTEQCRDEFHRNRDEAIAGSLKTIREQELKGNFPRMFRDHTRFDELRKAINAYEDLRKEILADVTSAALERRLVADELIDELFALAELVTLTNDRWEAAKRRYDRKNPPGKGKSYGDAVHWVCLLDVVPADSDLLIVSADRDFRSKIDPASVSDFLADEWKRENGGKLTLYPALTDLFREHYPDLRLLEELEKEMALRALAVRALTESRSFLETHAAVERLAEFSDFLPQETEALLVAALTNKEVSSILGDDDVYRFLAGLAEQYSDRIDPGLLADFWEESDEDTQPGDREP